VAIPPATLDILNFRATTSVAAKALTYEIVALSNILVITSTWLLSAGRFRLENVFGFKIQEGTSSTITPPDRAAVHLLDSGGCTWASGCQLGN